MSMTTAPKGALRSALAAGALMLGVAGLSAGCLDRPVQSQSPNTSNVFVNSVPNSAIDKIDLLFMIDNSISMTDKQEILKSAVPNLLARLIQPDCVDASGVKRDKDANGACPQGTKFEFEPINDIHIGAITSSLGSHGGERCRRPRNETPGEELYENDEAKLLPTVRLAKNLPAKDTGFLVWMGGGPTEVANLVRDFGAHVGAASESGCGFESSLEAWYRFLVDPNPPIDVVRDPTTGHNAPVLVAPEDNEVLKQRNAFLRSDSLLAIVMLSDENDCSILDVGDGWGVSTPSFAFYPASEICDTEPNNPCCYSCLLGLPPGSECSPSPRCDGTPLPDEQDRSNVRCAQQKKRFGFDLLWPVERYIEGLTKPTIRDYWQANAPEVPNPLFIARGDKGPRNPSLVFLAGIVGVPWQDLAKDPNSVSLVYKNAAEMRAEDNKVWKMILGDQGNGVMPTDPLMIESIVPRTPENISGVATSHPITNEALGTSGWNSINGNEYDNAAGVFSDQLPSNDDLQYACIFPLKTTIDCSAGQPDAAKCDCTDNLAQGKSLCKPPGGGTVGNTQHHAKAYPGTRFLEVLKGMGEVYDNIDNGIVASICPKYQGGNVPSIADDGYNPAVGAIIDRLKEKLGGQCLSRELDIENGRVPCYVIEASATLDDPGCTKAGREPVDAKVAGMVRRQLDTEGHCGGGIGETSCAKFQMCAIHQFEEGPDQDACFNLPEASVPGYCYIDPAQGPKAGGNNCDAEGKNCTNQFVTDCRGPKRKLRFIGSGDVAVPAPGAVTLTACVDS